MGFLGWRSATGVVDNSGNNPYGTGKYTATIDPKVFAVAANTFEIYHMAITGPAGSQCQVFVDRTFYDITPRGDINSWDPNQTLHMIGGQTLYFYWNLGTGASPQVTVWLQETSPLK